MTLDTYITNNIEKYNLNKDIISKNYSLENIITDFYKPLNSNINTIRLNSNINTITRQATSNNYASLLSGINWGVQRARVIENAYVQPTPDEVQRVLEAVHMIQQLPEEQQRQLIEATREIRYFFDGSIRSRFGATRHYNAIRCLNDPERTDIFGRLSRPNAQLAGEEFFALNRFMANFPDIADIQWWSVYDNGSWGLDAWNPEGEHLDTGVNGWGNLVGSVLKVNGRVLNPYEMIAFYRTIKLRDERGFMTDDSLEVLQSIMRALESEGTLPGKYEEQLETAHDLGLVDADGRTLTYAGRSMIMPVTARQRKQRQLTETDPEVRRIIIPTAFN